MTRKPFLRPLLLALSVCMLLCLCPTASASDADENGTVRFTEEELAYINSHGPLRVGYVQDRIPVSFTDKNGELAGISRYLFDRIAQISGLSFTYVPLPGGSITYDYLLGEKLDLVTSVEYNRENLNARGILMSKPYLTSRKVVVAREDLEFSYAANLSVALASGSQTIRTVLRNAYPNFEVRDYDTITDCFDAVRSGEADMMIQNQYVVEYWISKPAYESLKVIPVLGMDDEICFSAVVAFGGGDGVPEEEGRLLIGILNKTIDAITEDEAGTYTIQAIMENQYAYGLSDFLYRYRFAVAVFLVSTAVIVVLTVLLLRQRLRSLAAQSDAKAKGEFLSAMSHEIRTPLNGLVGLTYLMEQHPDDRQRLEGYLRQSSATAKYLLRLVNDLLDMSKLQGGELDLVLEPMDLSLTLSTVESLVRGAMSDKKLDFRVEAELTTPWLEGDEVRIQQVLLNLLDNARKFTPEGGKVVLRAAQETTEKGEVLTRMEVADTGLGMSEEFQKRAFHSFVQERNTVSKGNQGTGLGLSISRNLAQLMGGGITFTSRKGVGSQFFFTFTAQPAASPAAGTPAAPMPRTVGEKPRILVAEDNELNAEIMLELLEDEGFEAVLARDGTEAVEIFRASAPRSFGVILMDLLMPRMDGYQAAAAIRALPREDAKLVYIIACSANSFSEERERMLHSGMDDFLPKPVDIGLLLEKIAARRG